MELYVYVEDPSILLESSMLPGDLFTCKTLVVLTLGTNFVLNVPAKVCLPSLKILRFYSIVFSDDDSIERLFSSCVVLEDLVILGCQLKNIHKLNISSHTLKRLTIDFLGQHGYSAFGCEYGLVVNAPSLVCLVYNDYLADGYSLTNLSSLVEAHINVVLYSKTDDEYNDVGTEFIRGISNVRSLYLSFESMETIQSCCHPLPVFHNMTHLEVEHTLGQGLPDFLKGSPNLETLFFKAYYSKVFHWNPPEVVPLCLLFHLKEIKILHFEGKGVELEIVEYCLKNAKVLKKLTILLKEKNSCRSPRNY